MSDILSDTMQFSPIFQKAAYFMLPEDPHTTQEDTESAGSNPANGF